MAGRGRPFIFENAEELEKKINSYFSGLGDRPPTLSGLALHLKCYRQTLNEYIRDYANNTGRRSRGEMAKCGELLTQAKSRIEAYLEEKLLTDYSRGVEFTLSNGYDGWGNKTQIEAKVDADAKVKADVEERKLTDEELLDRINLLAAKAEEIRKRESQC